VPVALVATACLDEVGISGTAAVAFDRGVGSAQRRLPDRSLDAHHLRGAPVGRVLGDCSIPI